MRKIDLIEEYFHKRCEMSPEDYVWLIERVKRLEKGLFYYTDWDNFRSCCDCPECKESGNRKFGFTAKKILKEDK